MINNQIFVFHSGAGGKKSKVLLRDLAVSTRFVLSLEVLTCVAKIGRACRSVPFNTDPWSRVRDQFGDQNVRWMFR